jgi:hypothetical protein
MTTPLVPTPSGRTRIVLEVVADRPERAAVVIRPDGRHPMFLGEGSTDFLCGGCGVVLGQALDSGFLRRFLLVCPVCSACNRARIE